MFASRITITVALTWAVCVGGAVADNLTNKEVGYSIGLPKSFKASESGQTADLSGFEFLFEDYYQLDKAICEKAITPKDYPISYKRRCFTYFFPARTAADIAKLKAESEAKDENGKATFEVYLDTARVYQSFDEYAKARIQGFYFAEEKATKAGGFDCTMRELVFEKLTNVPQRWISCSYKVPGGEFAVMFTCTEQHFKEFKGEYTKAFGSLKFTNGAPKAKAASRSLTLEKKDTLSKDDYDKLSDAEKQAYFAKRKKEAFESARSKLPKGWTSYETKNFLVCHDGDQEFAKESSRHAEAVLDWLSDQFGSLGTNLMQSMILKCQSKGDPNPYMIFFSYGPGDVATVNSRKDWNGMPDRETLNSQLLSAWFQQKTDDLYNRMPEWLSWGMREMISDADSKSGKLTFRMDQYEKEAMAKAFKAFEEYKGAADSGPIRPVKTVLTSDGGALREGANAEFARAQATNIVRYFIEGPGAKNEKTRSFLLQYIANLSEEVAEVNAKLETERKASGGATDTRNMSDEDRLKAEDEAYKKKRDNEYSKIEKDLREKVLSKTLKDFGDKDWEALDTAWRSYAKNRIKQK